MTTTYPETINPETINPETGTSTTAVALDIRPALDDKIDFVDKISVGENRLSHLEMLAMHGLFVKDPKLRDVAWQEDIEHPISN